MQVNLLILGIKMEGALKSVAAHCNQPFPLKAELPFCCIGFDQVTRHE